MAIETVCLVLAQVEAKRLELIEKIADVDEAIGELFLMEEPVEPQALKDAIRRQVHHCMQGRGTSLDRCRVCCSSVVSRLQ